MVDQGTKVGATVNNGKSMGKSIGKAMENGDLLMIFHGKSRENYGKLLTMFSI